MTNKYNENYAQNMRERFHELKDGFSRCTILTELQKDGLKQAAETLVGEWYIERMDYLDEVGIEEKALLNDEQDPIREFYYDEVENGNPGDDYQFTKQAIEVPRYLNVDYWIHYKEII